MIFALYNNNIIAYTVTACRVIINNYTCSRVEYLVMLVWQLQSTCTGHRQRQNETCSNTFGGPLNAFAFTTPK